MAVEQLKITARYVHIIYAPLVGLSQSVNLGKALASIGGYAPSQARAFVTHVMGQ